MLLVHTNEKSSNYRHSTSKKSYTKGTTTEKNARISNNCNLGMKTDMRVLFAAFYSSTETVFLHTSGKIVRHGPLHSERHL
jgi:hypothetical protein